MSFDIGRSFQDSVDKIFNFLPQLVGGIVIIIVGLIVAKIVQKVLQRLLQRLRFDRAMHTSNAGNYISRVIESPSWLIGRVAYWLILLTFISFAVSALKLPVLNLILAGIYSYIPRVIAAILIFLVASAISAGSTKFVQRVMGRTATARLISAVIPTITMSLAVFMILNQLNIAKDIVNILFTAIVGSAALGLALAFGLGGRDVARDMLEQAVGSARDNYGDAKADVQRGAANARAQARQVKEQMS